ncbi:MAG: hypothetical protein N2319_11910 [Candidatus Kapabacteria bacterium]|nr:hypothetical protein [Candidatus Kapabacteria bacterium]
MRKIIFLMIFLIAMPILAEDDEMSTKGYLKIGPFITGKGGVNTIDPPQGIKNGFAVVPLPDFGVSTLIPFTPNGQTGALIDLAYSSYAYQLKIYGNEDVNWVERFSYFNIGPSFFFSGFIAGLNLGFPMGGLIGESKNSKEIEINSSDMGMLLEIKLGALLELLNTPAGSLNFTIQGGYVLSGLYKSETVRFNPQPAQLSLGLNFLFNVVNIHNEDY